MTSEGSGGINLVDNTDPSQQPDRAVSRTASASAPSSLTKRLTRGSVKSELTRRKYAKWQPDRLGIPDDNAPTRVASQSSNRTQERPEEPLDQQPTNGETLNIVLAQTKDDEDAGEVMSELDVLYENQRGWFFFGIPFYSHRSLLQFDPPAWVNRDFKDSPVDVTNAQVPDPSWEWAWRSWYVDMSDDVDEEGWQYSFSFASKFGWHGTHPWFHSYVRRRRWVRLRIKKKDARKRAGTEHTGLELAHRMNEDYFTIHSQKLFSGESSTAVPAGPPSAYTGRMSAASPEEALVEDIEDIPTLMQALKLAIVDRERIEALKKFVSQGGEELYYLEENIPEILSLFVFQTSRWQFLKCLQDAVEEASQQESETPQEKLKEAEARRRRRDNLARAAAAVSRQISGYEVFDVTKEGQLGGGNLGSNRTAERSRPTSSETSQQEPVSSRFGEIKGIPKAAEIGQERHIY
ncbi:hypothetical protein VTN77DRAFT_9633 [Rasamsonia byssochlamydoides]|uniref:uncharacterized protein n=1 Tax=Rasamsonia byssochlamydoides TaxID=89139 RepID=UPI003742DDF9